MSLKRAFVLVTVVLALAVPAFAAAPSNDDRGDARAVSVPSTLTGTTRDATAQRNDPGSGCADTEGSVWYSLDPSSSQRVSIELSAGGDLEAAIDVFRRDRSELDDLDCDATNRKGDAAVTFDAVAGEHYLIQVSQQFDSEPGSFKLELFSPEPEARPPGRRLPRLGGVATVDRAHDLTDAWSKRLQKGTTYVVTLAGPDDACPTVGVFEPPVSSFDLEEPVDTAACNRHDLFTPERSGRHSFLVRAGRGARGVQRYRLRVRPAGIDDTSPGHIIRNYQRVRGHVGPKRGDVVDLHRFYVHRRSDVTLRFSAAGDAVVELRNVRGRLLDRDFGSLRDILRRGRYYAVVRSRGPSGSKYTLRPAVRAITSAFISINGRHESVISPGQAATVGVRVSPPARGRIVIVVQRLDPLEGWQFYRRFVRRTASGRALATFVPRRPGRFRAFAAYGGSRLAAPSTTGVAYVSARERF